MRKYNILIVDNSEEASKITITLRSAPYYHNVRLVNKLSDAEALALGDVEGDPFFPYDFLFLDLTLDRQYLPKEVQEYAMKTISGWAFYEKILKDGNPGLYMRTIFYTAYLVTLRGILDEMGEGEIFNNLNTLSKTATDMVQEAVSSMNRMYADKSLWSDRI